MPKTYLEKLFYASMEATGGRRKQAKDLIRARACKDQTLLKALALNQLNELIDLAFSEYLQSLIKPANVKKISDEALEQVVAQIDANPAASLETMTKAYKQPSWKVASSGLVVMKTGQKSLSKQEIDHILDHYF